MRMCCSGCSSEMGLYGDEEKENEDGGRRVVRKTHVGGL